MALEDGSCYNAREMQIGLGIVGALELDSVRKGLQEHYGTFRDSLKAPIHRWFQYPAGYSYKFIEAKIEEYGLGSRSWILDPFVGCGTTLVVAKCLGVNSIGIEAHPFVRWVAQTKTFWEYDLEKLGREVRRVCQEIYNVVLDTDLDAVDLSHLPGLVRKCYSSHNLAKLVIIREMILQDVADISIQEFLKLALASTLRIASKAATGWPYIAPGKRNERALERDAVEAFCAQAQMMYRDICWVRGQVGSSGSPAVCKAILGDAREPYAEINAESIDLAITSPPYLNNYDYADRTRLETYFFGEASTWREITEKIRSKLMMSATTQIRRSLSDGQRLVSRELREASPRIYGELAEKVAVLSQRRLRKGGRKSYDIMVAGYFNDMTKVLREVHQVLKTGCDFILVLGDSAPYSVYIPTDEYLGELSMGLGFSKYRIDILRSRGGKWANNPQRHKVPLREVVLTITK